MEQTFLYHALASGVSGQVTLPFQHTIPVQAPSALPYTGGYSASRVEGFRYEQIVSFSSAETVTTGSETSKYFETLATATVEGLNILNVVTAERVVARLASRYAKESGEWSNTFAGSHFASLRIGGCLIQVDIDPERLKSARRSERARFGTFAAPVALEDSWGLEQLEDGAIHLPQFGKIYLAECLTTGCYQSIAMFHVILGCAVKGNVVAAHVSTNGEPMPG